MFEIGVLSVLRQAGKNDYAQEAPTLVAFIQFNNR